MGVGSIDGRMRRCLGRKVGAGATVLIPLLTEFCFGAAGLPWRPECQRPDPRFRGNRAEAISGEDMPIFFFCSRTAMSVTSASRRRPSALRARIRRGR
ncbi:hypothetical protein FRAAL6104 [Frankia alni ACN14a]|uniref:Uncharacterized protein n=1 Tax=Frankia alni (strain DSM 45986 / CECT 9034 / ACN14a) TaxID=326424 RepID=Q0RCU6_FRAAA|nr:hypothetical protein FRAAL6104 [Frankia alni ACN14a]